jgi:RNA-splicing ligase RtcB
MVKIFASIIEDEAPMAYKPIDVILNDIKDTVDIVKEIKPIYNFKAKN